MKKGIIHCLKERGFIDQVTSPELEEHLAKPRKIYVGFDPTADSLHLGSLMGLIGLEWFRRFGHQPVVILGGATGRIGDPSGKSSERPMLDDAELEHNVRSIGRLIDKLFKGSPRPLILNNNDWYKTIPFIDFLRDVGKLFRVNQMLAKESVRLRLDSEEGISFTEFSYQILQGYDFGYLHAHHGVTVQGGGSDQWGNITAGLEYNRKMGNDSIYGVTWPLLTRSDGKKFGKSEEGAVWLSEEKLAPYHFYQYLFRIPDADVIKLLSVLTFLEMEEIHHLERSMREAGYVPNTVQKRLAEEVTLYVHGEEGLAAARRVTEGMAPGSEAVLSAEVLQTLSGDMPSADMDRSAVVGAKLAELFVSAALASSKSEAVKLIKNGGAYMNNVRIQDAAQTVQATDLIENAYLLLSAGKKKRFLIKVCK